MKWVAAAALVSLALAGCASSEAPPLDDSPAVPLPVPIEPGNGAETPTLLVAPKADGGDLPETTGILGINAVNCVTLGDSLLVAPFGSKIDGPVVSLAGYGSFELDESVSVGGGKNENMAVSELDPAYAGCVPGDDTTVSIVFVTPKQP